MTEQASKSLRNTQDRMQEAGATSGISVPPLLRVRPCRETAQVFSQPEASHQPHYTAPAGTAFPLKYLAPKKALLTPSRQYVYDTMLYTNTFFFVKGWWKGCLFAFKTRLSLQELLYSSIKWDMPAEISREDPMPLHLCPWAGKLPISTSWELGEKRKSIKLSCVAVPD